MVIENFATLSVEEQISFAKELIEKINSGNIFSNETNFEFEDVEPNELTGGLFVSASLANPISISREATWSALDGEGAHEDPGNDAEYETDIVVDIRNYFQTFSAEIDGYDVSINIEDVDEDESVEAEVDVTNITEEDAGIGSYEFWGFKGYDSRPYVEVEGTITKAYSCSVYFTVEPAEANTSITEGAEKIAYEIWALGRDSDGDPIEYERYIGSKDTYEEALAKVKTFKRVTDLPMSGEDLEALVPGDYIAVIIETVRCKSNLKADNEIIDSKEIIRLFIK